MTSPWLNSWSQAVLTQAEDNLLLCFSDISCFALLNTKYLSETNYPATIIPVTPQIAQESVQENTLTEIDYRFNPDRLANLIMTQLTRGKKVFVSEIDGYYVDTLGMESQLLHLIPQGEVQEIACDLGYESLTSNTSLSTTLSQLDPNHTHHLIEAWKELMAKNHEVNATIYGRLGKKQLAREEIEAGLTLSDRHGGLSSLAQKLPYYPGDPRYQVTQVCRNADYWVSLSRECAQNDQVECQLRYLWWATLLEPTNSQLRTKYAKTLEASGQEQLAQIEWQHILNLDPSNGPALLKLNQR